MNSCMRCGNKLQHNYLVPAFKITGDKKEKLVVCFKCKDILKNTKEGQAERKQPEKKQPVEKNKD